MSSLTVLFYTHRLWLRASIGQGMKGVAEARRLAARPFVLGSLRSHAISDSSLHENGDVRDRINKNLPHVPIALEMGGATFAARDLPCVVATPMRSDKPRRHSQRVIPPFRTEQRRHQASSSTSLDARLVGAQSFLEEDQVPANFSRCLSGTRPR